MAGSEELGLMTARADGQTANLDSNIDQVDSQIDSVNDQITGVEQGMCEVAQNDLTGYLDGTKLFEIEAIYGTPINTPFSVDYGPNYGLIDYTDGGISDFSIIDSTGNSMYTFEGVHWDDDSKITKWVGDFAFGNDYLTRPLTSGASYGLYPTLTNLQSAKSLLQANKNKIAASKTAFEDYV